MSPSLWSPRLLLLLAGLGLAGTALADPLPVPTADAPCPDVPRRGPPPMGDCPWANPVPGAAWAPLPTRPDGLSMAHGGRCVPPPPPPGAWESRVSIPLSVWSGYLDEGQLLRIAAIHALADAQILQVLAEGRLAGQAAPRPPRGAPWEGPGPDMPRP